jgi:hypothetical protein
MTTEPVFADQEIGLPSHLLTIIIIKMDVKLLDNN